MALAARGTCLIAGSEQAVEDPEVAEALRKRGKSIVLRALVLAVVGTLAVFLL